MTYTTIDDTEILPDKPITTSLMNRLRDNPIAIANGDVGAPPIAYGAIATATWDRVLAESAVVQGIYTGHSWAEFHTPAANNDAAAIRCRDGQVVYFAAVRGGDPITQNSRATWYYPYIESGRNFFSVGSAYNSIATNIKIQVKAIISLQVDGSENCDLRLLVNDSVVETRIAISAGTEQVISFASRTLTPGTFETYSLQGQLDAGAGTDAMILDSVFIIPSLS